MIIIETKTFTLGLRWECFSKIYIDVPAHLTKEQAIRHIKDNWNEIFDEIGLPDSGYIPDSEKPCFDVHCELED